jgi:hypothetical protein
VYYQCWLYKKILICMLSSLFIHVLNYLILLRDLCSSLYRYGKRWMILHLICCLILQAPKFLLLFFWLPLTGNSVGPLLCSSFLH